MHNNISICTSVSRDCSNPVDSPRCRWILRLHSEEIVQLYFLKSLPSGCTSVTRIEGRGREKKCRRGLKWEWKETTMLLWNTVGCNTIFMCFRLDISIPPSHFPHSCTFSRLLSNKFVILWKQRICWSCSSQNSTTSRVGMEKVKY